MRQYGKILWNRRETIGEPSDSIHLLRVLAVLYYPYEQNPNGIFDGLFYADKVHKRLEEKINAQSSGKRCIIKSLEYPNGVTLQEKTINVTVIFYFL